MFELRFSEKIGVYTDVRSRLMDSYIGIVLLSLIEDIIDVSKIESNQLTVKIRDFDVFHTSNKLYRHFSWQCPRIRM